MGWSVVLWLENLADCCPYRMHAEGIKSKPFTRPFTFGCVVIYRTHESHEITCRSQPWFILQIDGRHSCTADYSYVQGTSFVACCWRMENERRTGQDQGIPEAVISAFTVIRSRASAKRKYRRLLTSMCQTLPVIPLVINNRHAGHDPSVSCRALLLPR